MIFHHYWAWKVTALIWAIAVTVVAIDQTVKVALVASGTAILVTLINKFVDRWFPSKHIEQIQAGQNRIEISLDGNFKRMLDDKEKSDALAAKATSRADTAEAHALGRTEGVAAQHSEKEKQ